MRDANLWFVLMCLQTLRFVQSLPKRERQPLKDKFRNADPLGKLLSRSSPSDQL